MPQEWLEIIRKYGGQMKETYGVPVEEIVEGIRHGVRKVNIDTDIRLAMTGAMRRHMAEKPSEFDPRKFLADAQKAAQGDLQGALRGLRLRRAGVEDQAAPARGHGGTLSQGRPEPDRPVAGQGVATASAGQAACSAAAWCRRWSSMKVAMK